MEWLTQSTEWVNNNAGLMAIIVGSVVLLALAGYALANRKKVSKKRK